MKTSTLEEQSASSLQLPTSLQRYANMSGWGPLNAMVWPIYITVLALQQAPAVSLIMAVTLPLWSHLSNGCLHIAPGSVILHTTVSKDMGRGRRIVFQFPLSQFHSSANMIWQCRTTVLRPLLSTSLSRSVSPPSQAGFFFTSISGRLRIL